MILADIYFQSIQKTCDFQLDETAAIFVVIEEIVEIIKKKTGTYGTLGEGEHPFVLCSVEHEIILEGDRTLASYGVRNGSRLLII